MDTESDIYTHKLLLVQIATEKDCFLIRGKHVGRLNQSLLEQLGEVLSTKMIIFFVMRNDSEQMAEFIPDIVATNLLDIQKLVNELVFTVVMPNNETKQAASLSDCVEHWLGKPLDKSYTLSLWGTDEELCHEQTVYAA